MLALALLLMVSLTSSAGEVPPGCPPYLFQSGDRLNIRWKKVDFRPIFQALQEAGVSLNYSAFVRDERSPKILQRLLTVPIGPRSFGYGVHMRFGSWDEGLRQNGIDPLQWRIRFPPDLSEEQAVQVLRRLYEAGEPVSATGLNFRQGGARADRIIFETLGHPISQQGFYQRAMRRYKSWRAALSAAGINPAEVMYKEIKLNLSRELVIAQIQFLFSLLEGDVRLSNLRRHKDRIKLAIYSEFQMIVSSASLSNWAEKEFGSWRAALEAAGVPTSVLSTSARPPLWTKELLIEILQELSIDVDMRRRRFWASHVAVKKLTEELYGYPIAAAAIYNAAIQLFGSWKNALRAADIELPQIEPAVIPLPESERLRLAAALLNGDQRQIADLAIKYLNEHDEFKSGDLVEFIRRNSGRNWDWTDVSRVLRILADNLP
jgi:hypothetical protein